ncbi:hypothetical protein ACI6PX_06495 [Proteus sp. NGCRVN-01]|uniref:hypothetical protein n=1 Tax=Proteus sp. NGCRVN-01 TaxID=3380534 RepID=UPI00387154B2
MSYDEFTSLFLDKNQYITWILVLAGWGVSVKIACSQVNQGKILAKSERIINNHNESVRLLREKINKYEDFCLDFWTIKKIDEQNPQLTLMKIASKLKEITDISRDIQNLGGGGYPRKAFMDLRKFTTNDKELDNRPLSINSTHVDIIRLRCREIKKLYQLKDTN